MYLHKSHLSTLPVHQVFLSLQLPTIWIFILLKHCASIHKKAQNTNTSQYQGKRKFACSPVGEGNANYVKDGCFDQEFHLLLSSKSVFNEACHNFVDMTSSFSDSLSQVLGYFSAVMSDFISPNRARFGIYQPTF